MEPKPSPSPSPQPDATPPRHRGAAGKAKRKAAATASSSPSPPPKRQARERNPFDLPSLPPPHSGPLTRAARQSPLNPAREYELRASDIRLDGEGEPPRSQEAATLPPVDQEFESVRSRGAGVHVVPTFAGWFSWKEIHPVEKQTLASFFNGKSERRTPEIYLEIRNFIMKKFHANPQVHLDFKDLSELSNGEMDARLEVLEFLSHWGLVNFHPFLPAGQEGSKPVESKSNADTEDKTSLVEKLFQFETVQSYLVPVPNKAEVAAPAQVPGFLSEPTLAEDLITAAESSVEYHCNSCSVDCSRKRYHCRTQADFDLCCDCYNERKFDAGMSQTDFILMESAEVPGSGGASWTDQETLLLLEALEIFKAKWGDIAEHVATKSKAQCMLHFLQMPILDSFLDGADVNQTSQETTEQVSAEKGTSDVPDKMEVDKAEKIETTDAKTSEKTDAHCAETERELADDNVVGNKDTKVSGDIDVFASSNTGESDKSSDPDPAKKETSADADIPGKSASNVVIDVLKSAFEAVGHIPEKEDWGSFAEAGNPVMALAAFLAGLVEHDDAVTSCCSLLKAISKISPALQLATRHCFILQDPPNDLEDLPVSVSPSNTGDEQQQDNGATPNPNDTDKDSNEKKVALPEEKQNTTSTSTKDHQESNRRESSNEAPQVEAKSNSTMDSGNPIVQVKGGASDNMRETRNSTSHPVTLNDTNEPASIASQEAGEGSIKDTFNPEWVEKDKPNSEESPTDDPPLQGKVEPDKIEHVVAASSTVQHESNQTSLETGNKEELKSNKNIAEDSDSLQRLQRAAATAISAAAVKAKLLAELEEDQIWRLAALAIEKQFQKMQTKMSFFTEIENLILQVREYTEKTRKKLLMERSAIIAARMAAMPSRPNQPGAPGIRLPLGYGVHQQLRRP